MITNKITNKTKFAAIYNAGFPSPEDDFYCETLEELRDELFDRDEVELIDGTTIISNFDCSIFIRNNWVAIPLTSIFGSDDFYTEEQWIKILGL